MTSKRDEGRLKRKRRIRKHIQGTSERPRLTVFRSLKHVGAQLIDDGGGATLASASTIEKDLRDMKGRATCNGAKRIGELIAERALARGITSVVFDRNGYQYHGQVKALAEAARQKGLKF